MSETDTYADDVLSKFIEGEDIRGKNRLTCGQMSTSDDGRVGNPQLRTNVLNSDIKGQVLYSLTMSGS